MNRIVISFILLLLYGSAQGETKPIDSLQLLLNAAEADSVRVDLLNALAWEYHRVDIKKTVDYSQQAIDLAQQIEYIRGNSRALNLLAIGSAEEGKHTEAIQQNEEALSMAMKIGDSKLQSNALNDLAISFSSQNRFAEALKYYQLALDLVTDENKLEKCFTLGNIGHLHNELGNYKKGLYYLNKAIVIAEKSDDHLVKVAAYENMAYTYLDQNKLDTAYLYFQKVLNLSQANGNKLSTAYAMLNMGHIEVKKKKFEIANIKYKQAILIFQELGSYSSLPDVYLALGHLQEKRTNYRQAIKYFQKAINSTTLEQTSYVHSNSLKGLANCHSELGDYKQAFQYQKELQRVSDSTYNEKNSRHIAELEAQYETEKKDIENKMLKELKVRNEATIGKQKMTSWAISIFLLLVSLAVVILYTAYKRKLSYNNSLTREVASRTADLEKSNEQLKRSNKELESFAYIASHDLKEPLRNIFSFTRLLERKLKSKMDEQTEEYFSFIKQNTQQLNVLIEDVLEYSKVDKGSRRRERVEVNTILDRIKMVLPPEAAERGVQINYAEMPIVWSYSSSLFLVFKNLIENGIKYNKKEQPQLSINYAFTKEKHVFSVVDNGIGIEKEYHQQIFEMFKRLHTKNTYQGSGLGLAICKKIVDRLNGEIWVEKSTSEGTTISFSLPYDGKQKSIDNATMSKIAMAN